jgi:hypothetical protein
VPFRCGIVTLARFPRLHAGVGVEARLRMEDGLVRVASLGTPRYSGAFEPDLASMMPLEQWSFDPLEADP